MLATVVVENFWELLNCVFPNVMGHFQIHKGKNYKCRVYKISKNIWIENTRHVSFNREI